jgi:hypothetical protein
MWQRAAEGTEGHREDMGHGGDRGLSRRQKAIERGDIGQKRVQSIVRAVDGTEGLSETEGFRKDEGYKGGRGS